MKKLLPIALAAMFATPALAGSLAAPAMEPAVIEAQTSSSAGGLLIPIFLLVLLAAAASGSSSYTAPT